MRVFRVKAWQDNHVDGWGFDRWNPDLPAEMLIFSIPPVPDVDNPEDRGGHCIAQIHLRNWWDNWPRVQLYVWDPDRRQGEGAFTPDLDPRERKSIRELMDHSEVVPDLRDPGTQGCVLALVREAMRDPAFTLNRVCIEGDWHGEKGRCIRSSHRKPWAWESFKHGYSASRKGFDTEAEALVDALERAQLLEAAS